ncbi:hypothetical protein [Planktotalea sp.]|uniref:hypothetical protein n=1 Tax=Planktotalea sp. TaxID=2029877 RepID=UPI003D6BCFB5
MKEEEPSQSEPSTDRPRQRRLFLERRSYTQRRIVDGVRILPVIALVLFMIPLIWPKGSDAGSIDSSTSTFYVFVAWCALIIAGAVIATRIGPINEASNNDAASGDSRANPSFNSERGKG